VSGGRLFCKDITKGKRNAGENAGRITVIMPESEYGTMVFCSGFKDSEPNR